MAEKKLGEFIRGALAFLSRAPRGASSDTGARGADLVHDLELSFEEAALGTEVTLRVPERGSGPETTLKVQIPAGVDTGTRIRLAGQGELGRPAGDLFVRVHVNAHPVFVRDQDHVLCEVAVSMMDAILGAVIEVPTLEGPAKMQIPSGTQGGKIFRLKGKGSSDLKTRVRGDLHVRIAVETPRDLNDKQRELLRALFDAGSK